MIAGGGEAYRLRGGVAVCNAAVLFSDTKIAQSSCGLSHDDFEKAVVSFSSVDACIFQNAIL